MVSNSQIIFSTVAALDRIETELPNLIGSSGWEIVGEKIKALIHQIKYGSNSDEQDFAYMDLIALIAPYHIAHERLDKEIAIQETIEQEYKMALATFAKTLRVKDTDLTSSSTALTYILQGIVTSESLPTTEELKIYREENQENRGNTSIKLGGIGGGKNIRFRKLNIKLDDVSLLGASIFLHIFATAPNPLLIALGVIWAIAKLKNAMTIPISEHEASVFWGLIQSRNPLDKTISEEKAYQITNQERHNYNLDPLHPSQFQRALKILEELQSIQPVYGKEKTWKIVDNYTIEQ